MRPWWCALLTGHDPYPDRAAGLIRCRTCTATWRLGR